MFERMRFSDWLKAQPRGTLKSIERGTGVGYTTLQKARRGRPLFRYDVAKAISDWTGGEVTIKELCELPDGR